jgi:hypothetical protein
MHGGYASNPNTPSWRGAQLKKGAGTLPFSFKEKLVYP